MRKDEQQSDELTEDRLRNSAAWEDATEHVTPNPTGMTVYSLRIPTAELAALKAEADARGATVSEVVRSAIRNFLAHRASGALSYGQVSNVRIVTAENWRGGSSAPSEISPTPSTVLIGMDGSGASREG